MRRYRNGLGAGFSGPSKPAAPKPAAPIGPSGGMTSAPYYATASGFAKRPIYPRYALSYAGTPTIQPAQLGPVPAPFVSFYDDSRRFQYTAEQAREMKERRARQVQDAQEMTHGQTQENGDGTAPALEQDAREAQAMQRAIDTVATGAGMPADGKPIPAAPQQTAIPAALAAALLYFLL